MFRPRIIPVLLLNKNHLIKSVQFKKYTYIGDPVNAVKIFNDLKADELVFLDITATKEKRTVSLDFVKEVGEEANMPFAVGGGVKTIDDIKKIVSAGAEKVVIGHQAIENPDFIKEASETFGSSTIVVCIDIKRNFWGTEKLCTLNATSTSSYNLEKFAELISKNGAGEIIIQSVDNDGLMKGYDIDIIKRVSQAVDIPVIALGGAGNYGHLSKAYFEGHANGLAAGSLFVYQGVHKGVLINYPNQDLKRSIYEE
jgi:cyclase